MRTYKFSELGVGKVFVQAGVAERWGVYIKTGRTSAVSIQKDGTVYLTDDFCTEADVHPVTFESVVVTKSPARTSVVEVI